MIRVSELAARLGAELRVQPGSADPMVSGVASAERAEPGDLVFAEAPASLEAACASRSCAVLTLPAMAGDARRGAAREKPLLLSSQPRLDFARAAKLLQSLAPPGPDSGKIHPTAVIGAEARIAKDVTIGAFAVLGAGVSVGEGTVIDSGATVGAGVVLGRCCHIYPRVVIYPGAITGDRVIVHAGAVLGADGFGYVRDPETGEYTQFPQRGVLVLEDDVEIGANSTIDRGALAETRIARGSKLDNLVHIGHNVRIGRQVVMAAQTGISGSCRIGDRAVFGGQVGIGDHAEVGEGVILGGQGGVLPMKKLRGDGVAFWGTPAKPLRRYLQELAAITRAARESRRRGSGQIQRRDPQPDPQLDQPEAPNGGEDNGGRDKDA